MKERKGARETARVWKGITQQGAVILKSEKQGDRSDSFYYYYSYIKHSLKEQRRKPIRNFLDSDKQIVQ